MQSIRILGKNVELLNRAHEQMGHPEMKSPHDFVGNSLALSPVMPTMMIPPRSRGSLQQERGRQRQGDDSRLERSQVHGYLSF